MENKTTIELLELINKLEVQSNEDPNGGTDWYTYAEAIDTLKNREPFKGIMGESEDPNDPSLEERVEELEDLVKKLRRHSHHEKSGDVVIRI